MYLKIRKENLTSFDKLVILCGQIKGKRNKVLKAEIMRLLEKIELEEEG